MKNSYKILLSALLLLLYSCADLDVENTMEPDRERALSDPSDLISLLSGATTDMMMEIVDLPNVHINGLADQTTSTNAYISFWAHCDQPRNTLSNFSTYDDLFVYTDSWNTANSVVSTANLLINAILTDGTAIIDENDEDQTMATLAGAYFIRGVAQMTIGLKYDKGYVVDETTDLSTIELVAYKNVVDAAMVSFDKALEILEENSSVGWNYFPTQDYSNEEFIEIINSYAARTLINYPRTEEEAAANDYDLIISYASEGISEDFLPIGEEGVIFANAIDWEQYVLSDGAGYLPADQKIPYLFDPDNQPKDYPTGSTVLDPAETDDKRIDLYFGYSPNFGYLREDRGRILFSNYYKKRWENLGNDADYSSSQIPFFLTSEIHLILAEAYLRKGESTKAAEEINKTNRTSVGELPDATSGDDLAHILFYEYSIELDNTGQHIQWYFMRRYGLLQKGTPLHLPVPVTELELLGESTYSFGGESNADGVNTALGTNAWNN